MKDVEVRKSKSEAIRESRLGRKWYTDGRTNLALTAGEAVPTGFVPGFRKKTKEGAPSPLNTPTVNTLNSTYWTYDVDAVINEVLNNKFTILLGPAGSGKTTCAIKALVREAATHHNVIISNSHKCLNNIRKEFVAECERVGLDYNTLKVSYITNFKMRGLLDTDATEGIDEDSVVFIDEAGFIVNDGFMDSITRILRKKARLIVAGDIAQYSSGPWLIQMLTLSSNIDQIVSENMDDPFYQAYLGNPNTRRLLLDATVRDEKEMFLADESMRPHIVQIKSGKCPWSARFDGGFDSSVLMSLRIDTDGYYLVSSPDQTDPESLGCKVSLALQKAKAAARRKSVNEGWHPNDWFYPVFPNDKFVIKAYSSNEQYRPGDVLRFLHLDTMTDLPVCFNEETSSVVVVEKEHFKYIFNEQVTSAQNCQGTREWKRTVYAVLNMGPYLTADLLNLIETRACGDIYFIIRNKKKDTILGSRDAVRYLNRIHGHPSITDKLPKASDGSRFDIKHIARAMAKVLKESGGISRPSRILTNEDIELLEEGGPWYKGSPLYYTNPRTMSISLLVSIVREYLRTQHDLREVFRFINDKVPSYCLKSMKTWKEKITETVGNTIPCGKRFSDFVYFFERTNTHTPDNRYNRIPMVASFCVYNPVFFGQDSYTAISEALKDYDDPIFLEWFEECYDFFMNKKKSGTWARNASTTAIKKWIRTDKEANTFEEIESTELTGDDMNMAICATYPAMKKELPDDTEQVENILVTVKKPDGDTIVRPWKSTDKYMETYDAAVKSMEKMKVEAPENEYWLTKVLPGTNTVVIDCDGDPAMTEAFRAFCKERGINPLMMTSPTDPNRWHAYGATTFKFRPIHSDKLKWKSDILTNSIEFLKDKVPSGEDFLVGKDLADWLRMMDANNQS